MRCSAHFCSMYSSSASNSPGRILSTCLCERVCEPISKPMRCNSAICSHDMYFDLSSKSGGNSQTKNVAPKPNCFSNGATWVACDAEASSKVKATKLSGARKYL